MLHETNSKDHATYINGLNELAALKKEKEELNTQLSTMQKENELK